MNKVHIKKEKKLLNIYNISAKWFDFSLEIELNKNENSLVHLHLVGTKCRGFLHFYFQKDNKINFLSTVYDFEMYLKKKYQD